MAATPPRPPRPGRSTFALRGAQAAYGRNPRNPGATLPKLPPAPKRTTGAMGGTGVGPKTRATGPKRDPFMLPPSVGEKALTDYIAGFDQRGQAAQQYAANTVLPWASGALGGVADSVAQTLGSLGQVMGQQGAPIVTPPSFQGSMGSAAPRTSPGVAQGAAGYGRSLALQGAYQGSIGAARLGAGVESTLAALGQKVAQIPNVFAQQKQDFMARVTPVLAQLEQARVSRADRLRQQSFENQLAVQKTILSGVGGTGTGKGTGTPPNPDGSAPTAPGGYVYTLGGDGLYHLHPDRTNVGGGGGGTGGGGKAGAGQYDRNQLAKGGYVGGWSVKPANVKGPLVQATDGTWWKKQVASKTGPGSVNYSNHLHSWVQQLPGLVHGHDAVYASGADPKAGDLPVKAAQPALAPSVILTRMLSSGVNAGDAINALRAAGAKFKTGPDGAAAIYHALIGGGIEPDRARHLAANLSGDFHFLTGYKPPKKQGPVRNFPTYTGPGGT